MLISLAYDNKAISFKCGQCLEVGNTNFAAISREGYTGKCSYCSDKYRPTYTKIFKWEDKDYYIIGYEDKALQCLKESGYKNTDVLAGVKDEIPIISYQINNRTCEYHPDIFIPIENKIIEVKSEWTLLHDENFTCGDK